MGLYGYEYEFSTEKMQEIMNPSSRIKLEFAFEMRTKFILRTRLPPKLQGVVTAADVCTGSEAFCALTYARLDNKREEVYKIHQATIGRLYDYSLTRTQALEFLDSAVLFARHTAARTENATRKLIPIVVDFWVYTVQQENESYEDAMNRALNLQARRTPSLPILLNVKI